jgi:hypothetical protein
MDDDGLDALARDRGVRDEAADSCPLGQCELSRMVAPQLLEELDPVLIDLQFGVCSTSASGGGPGVPIKALYLSAAGRF